MGAAADAADSIAGPGFRDQVPETQLSMGQSRSAASSAIRWKR